MIFRGKRPAPPKLPEETKVLNEYERFTRELAELEVWLKWARPSEMFGMAKEWEEYHVIAKSKITAFFERNEEMIKAYAPNWRKAQ